MQCLHIYHTYCYMQVEKQNNKFCNWSQYSYKPKKVCMKMKVKMCNTLYISFILLSYTAKLLCGKTFTVWVVNGHSQENFHSYMLVLIVDFADRQGHMTLTCWHFSYGSQTAAYHATNKDFWVDVAFIDMENTCLLFRG